ncbi:hypothetical protein Ddye_009908 [Dipteronia dyeriana]|uniref:SWIM-type domain-containing protein n=1 Tax=Dipteronia dyeriana TaxID=168575 RepID=A0AAD9XCW6_9ROSI|nr:hypothetical protein Ddye_009908 [Dipteronia dyeriana]
MCIVPPEVADHADILGPQFDDVSGCQFQMNSRQYNHQYNKIYNDINNEQNTTPNVGPIHEVDNEGNFNLVDNVENNGDDEDPVQIERHNFEWKVKRSNKKTLHLVCLMENCTWKLRTVMRDEGTYFQVRSFVNEHTCPLEEIHRRHRQTIAVIIGEVVAHRLQQQNGILMRPKDIITDMKSYGIQIMYSKAHTTLDYTLSLTYGTHEKTFQLLPSFCYVLEQKNPGTITDLQCDEAEFEYNLHMEELRNLNQNAYDYVIDVGPHKWSRVRCPKRRYKVITTNAAECINSCLKFARQLSMLTLAEFIRNILQWWFHYHYRAVKSNRHQFTDAAHLVILKHVEKCGFMTVNPVDWNIFSVKQSGKQWIVDLARKTCTCNKFQMDHFLCSHTLAAARHPSTWVVPSDITQKVILNPISKRRAERPRASQHVLSSKSTTTQSCRRCGQPKHNSRRCSNPPLINKGPSRGVPDEYRQNDRRPPRCAVWNPTSFNVDGKNHHNGVKYVQLPENKVEGYHQPMLAPNVTLNLVSWTVSTRGSFTDRLKILFQPSGL